MSGGTLRGARTRTPTHSVWELTSDGIVFGGSWYSSAANVRTGSGYDLGSGGLGFGFRCAVEFFGTEP